MFFVGMVKRNSFVFIVFSFYDFDVYDQLFYSQVFDLIHHLSHDKDANEVKNCNACQC